MIFPFLIFSWSYCLVCIFSCVSIVLRDIYSPTVVKICWIWSSFRLSENFCLFSANWFPEWLEDYHSLHWRKWHVCPLLWYCTLILIELVLFIIRVSVIDLQLMSLSLSLSLFLSFLSGTILLITLWSIFVRVWTYCIMRWGSFS